MDRVGSYTMSPWEWDSSFPGEIVGLCSGDDKKCTSGYRIHVVDVNSPTAKLRW